MASAFIVGGLIVFIEGIPDSLLGGTIIIDGQSTDDIVLRLFATLFPLVLVVLGIFLFRAKPYYPSHILHGTQEEDLG